MTTSARPSLRALTAALALSLLAASAAALTCATPGRDGVGSSLTGIVNTYYPGKANAAAGATSLTLGTARGSSASITAGDLLLVVQMQDATINTTDDASYGSGGTSGSGATAIGAGKYEYVVAMSASTGDGSVTIRGESAGGGLKNSYANSDYNATTPAGAKRFQVIRVPQYSSATLGAALTASAWDGTSGGVVAIDVAGTLNLSGGTLDVSGLGFRGGGGRGLNGVANTANNATYRSLASNNYHGQKGEGIAGTPQYLESAGALLNSNVEGYPLGSSARGAPGNAGGGGTDSNSAANDENSGGGGGAGAGAGGQGGRAWSSRKDVGGIGGAGVTPVVTALVLGGGGGAGSTNNATGTPANGLASSGAAGGGLVLLRAGTVSGTGTIKANGANANNSVVNDGSGGGGGGGSVLASSPNALPSTLTIQANGGTGGTNTGGGSSHGPGGGGGGGAVVLSSTGPTVTVTGGANGTTASDGTYGTSFGAVGGSVGTQLTTAAPANLPGSGAPTLCLPALTVVKTTSTPTRVRGTDLTATYTVVVTNTGGGASGVAVTDALPSPFAYGGASVTPAYANTSSGTVASGPASVTGSGTTTVTFGTAGGTTANSFSLPQNGQVTLTFNVNLNSPNPGTYQNPANVSYTDPTRTADTVVSPGGPYAGGGTAGGSNYDSASKTGEDVTVQAVDIAVSKTVSSAYAKPEDTANNKANPDSVTYTIKAWNNGPNAVGTTTLVDTVPSALTNVTWSCAATGTGAACGTASGTGNSISLSPTLPVDANTTTGPDTVYITITVTGTTPTRDTLEKTAPARTITNTATVSNAADYVSGDDSASATTNTIYARLGKTVQNITKNGAADITASGLPGELLEYCINYNNYGGATLPNFTVTDQVPGNTSAVLTAYDSAQGTSATGFGVKLVRGTTTTYLTSASDTDAGTLTSSGGTYGSGTMTVGLGNLLSGETGSVCFRSKIK